MNRILIVDDDSSIRITFSAIMKMSGFFPLEASDGRQAVEIFKTKCPDAVVLDLKMPGMDGMETMKELRSIDSSIPIIIVTGHGDISTAVQAIKLGAYDFITKPLDLDGLLLILRRAIEKLELQREVKRLHRNVDKSYELFFGKSPAIKEIISQIQQIARTNFSIIIQGETGTGKSYIANLIHGLSKRFDKKFITIDMGAIPDSLAESELFGYEKGAFTGAEKRKTGLLQNANGGTVLIDELQNMSPNMQSKLLRAIEERKIVPLGGLQPIDIDIRIIAATNTDLKQAVDEKLFREDLFFRLGEIILHLPPLRQRMEDIPILAGKFCRETGEELNKNIQEISEEALDILKHYQWPGNVRQLKNAIRRAVLFCHDNVIKGEDVNPLLEDDSETKRALPSSDAPDLTLKDAEKRAIINALEMTKGNKTKAAFLLKINYTTLLRKMRDFKIV